MIRAPFFYASLTAATLLTAVGCDQDPGTDNPKEVTASDVRHEAGQAASAASQYAGQTLAEYRDSMQTRIDSLNEDISSLASKAEELAGDAKAEANKAVDSLKTKRDAFVERLSTTAQDSKSAWSDMKAGLDSAWQELDAARKSAMDRFGG